MGRVYTATFEAISVSAVQDLFEILAPADACVVIHEIVVTQEVTETSEQLPVQLKRASGSYTSGSGGSTITPTPHVFGDAAFGGTVERNNTTQAAAGSGALTVIRREGWNVLSGYSYHPTPEERIILSPSQALIVSLPTAPGAALTVSGSAVIEELGG